MIKSIFTLGFARSQTKEPESEADRLIGRGRAGRQRRDPLLPSPASRSPDTAARHPIPITVPVAAQG
jgi:hypothetical protein